MKHQEHTVLAALAALPIPRSVNDITSWTKIGRRDVRMALYELKRRSLAKIVPGTKKWTATPDGFDHFAAKYNNERTEIEKQNELRIRSAAAAYYINR